MFVYLEGIIHSCTQGSTGQNLGELHARQMFYLISYLSDLLQDNFGGTKRRKAKNWVTMEEK